MCKFAFLLTFWFFYKSIKVRRAAFGKQYYYEFDKFNNSDYPPAVRVDHIKVNNRRD